MFTGSSSHLRHFFFEGPETSRNTHFSSIRNSDSVSTFILGISTQWDRCLILLIPSRPYPSVSPFLLGRLPTIHRPCQTSSEHFRRVMILRHSQGTHLGVKVMSNNVGVSGSFRSTNTPSVFPGHINETHSCRTFPCHTHSDSLPVIWLNWVEILLNPRLIHTWRISLRNARQFRLYTNN